MDKKLRIGLIIDSYLLQAWKCRIIEDIIISGFAEIALIILKPKGDLNLLGISGKGSFVYRLHHKLDRLIFKSKNDYSRVKDSKALLSGFPHIFLHVTFNRVIEGFTNEETTEISKYNLDLILNIGSGIIAGPILKVPRYGVWAYTMDNFNTEKEGTSGYFEVVMKKPVTCSELVLLSDPDEDNIIIFRAYEATCSYSIHLNRNRIFWRASLFVTRAILGIYKSGESYIVTNNRKFSKDTSESRKKNPPPSFKDACKFFSLSMVSFFLKVLKKLFYSDPFNWILLFSIEQKDEFPDNKYGSFTKLKPLKSKFWADPFIVKRNERYYVFVEEFIYTKNKGHISVLEIDRSGKLLNTLHLIEKSCHMSYPFVFEFGEEFYMIPETRENNSIELYKCTGFPGKWEFLKTIMQNLNAVDTTLFNYNGKWWLFTVIDYIDSPLDGSPELYLFYSDDFLSGIWVSHPLNPVISDIRTARPAGRIFIKDGKIFRPSQDCSGRYGEAFNINQVLTLTETDYEEVQIKKVVPDWDSKLKGTHTFNIEDEFTIIDAYYYRRRPFLVK